MIARFARLQAQPEKVDRVRRALEDMVRSSRTEDPMLGEYVLYESDDDPGQFLIEQHVSTVEEALDDPDRENQRLMELGTALREQLIRPITIDRYRMIVGEDGPQA
ncbi:MAG: antibiotic biosynthesis monooxygenase [Dehalococcoidia bacterium]|nr:antibiotic biosynthesis monooxygenase [Dehalococcoidia bacterium]